MPRAAQTVVFVLVGLLVMLIGGAWLLLSRPSFTDRKLGGAWELRRADSLTIGSGNPPDFLQRVHGKQRTTIAERPYPYQYLGDDCMLFTVWSHGEFEVRAACGDRPPIVVARPPNGVSAQDLEHDPAKIGGTPYSWSDLKQHVLRGEPF